MTKKGPLPHPTGPHKRRVLSIPGVFNGIPLRSQLEIKFATELENRQIHWKYEPERIGAGGYLVDFYLPDLRCWVEVKGERDARDNLLLPNVAIVVQRDRGERLFMYMQNEAFAVGPRGFKPLTHEEFWAAILNPPEPSKLVERNTSCESTLSGMAKRPRTPSSIKKTKNDR
jgi:hypothetical protein